MQRHLQWISICLTSLALLIVTPARAAIVHHEVNYTGTVAGGAVAFDFTDGSVLPGSVPPSIGINLIPSNAGANMQIQYLTGSDGGVVITTGAVSYLAEKYSAGTLIDGSIPLDTTSLPGFSTALGVGVGKIRFFGAGNFASGERGFVGMRFQGGAYYGWAEISAIDDTSFTVYQFAYDDSGAPIEVGDRGPGVASIARNGFGNDPSLNWPAGTWYVTAIQLDESGGAVGKLVSGFNMTLLGSSYRAFVDLEMLATAPATHRVRVFRKQSLIVPGDSNVEFADYLCDDGGGGLAALCDASAPSPVGGGFGALSDSDFTGVGAVPNGEPGVALISVDGSGNDPTFNWSAGTWHVKAILMDGWGNAVGNLSDGVIMVNPGNAYPAFVSVQMRRSAPSTYRIRVFRNLGPISQGDTNVEFADFGCDDPDTPKSCDFLSGGSLISDANGRLKETDFTGVGVVPDGAIGVASITQNGSGNTPAWNWPTGTWHVSAILLNYAGDPLSLPSARFEFVASGNLFPAFVKVTMFATASATHAIRVFRSPAPINPGDTGLEYVDFSCDDGSGGIADICDAFSGAALINGVGGYLKNPDFTGVGDVPSVVVGAPESPLLRQLSVLAYPNPFNPRVTMQYSVPARGQISLRIYDAAGRFVRELQNGVKEAGEYSAIWDGRDRSGRAVSSGIYFARTVTAAGVAQSKMALIR